jgi:WD40 repeat protein/pSer/pThr/pTyr-binding forkhead associated (FHA) protein
MASRVAKPRDDADVGSKDEHSGGAERAQMSAAIERLQALNPDAVKLAEVVAFAVMIDRALLRAARLELLPAADVGAEVDLWFSALVQTRTADGIVLDSAVAEELRRGMSAERIEEVWALTDREHAGLAPSLRIEEEIAYLSFSKKPTASEQLARKLRSVLAAMVSGERVGLARWATRALAMFPSAVRDLPEAKMLDMGARMRLGEEIHVAPDAALPEWTPWVAPPSLGSVGLSFELREEELEIRTDPTGKPQIEIPNTNPLVLEVSWEKQTKQITFRRGEVVQVPVGRGELRIRTITGEEYDLREPGYVPDRFRERILDFSEELERYSEFVGRDRELERARSWIGDRRFLTVLGELGIGKSAFLCEIVRQFTPEMPVFVHFFRGGNFKLESIPAAVRSLVAQIALRFRLDERVLDMRLAGVLDHLAIHPNRPERMLIVLDDVDEARGEQRELEVQPIGEIVPANPPEFVTVIASTRNEKQKKGAEIVLGAVDDETLMRRFGFRTSPDHPRGSFAVAEILTGGIDGHIEDVVNHFLKDQTSRFAVGMVALQKEALAIDAPDNFLLRRAGWKVEIINELARELVRNSPLIDRAECHRGIVRLVEHSADNRAYYLLYGPTHLVEAGDVDKAQRLILDIAFMTEKIERFGVDAVIADLRKVVSSSKPGTLPRRVLETMQQERYLFEESLGELPAILYSRLLNEQIPHEQIIAELNLPPLPLIPAARVSANSPVDPGCHDEPIVGSAWIELPEAKKRVLATWSADGFVKVWGGQRAVEVLGHRDDPSAVTAFAAGGGHAVTTTANGFLHVWNLRNQFRQASVAAHERAIDGMLFDGKIVVTWSGHDPIRVWDFVPDQSFEPPDELTGHSDAIAGCTLLPNDGVMISVSRDGECRMWNMNRRIAIGTARLSAPATAIVSGYEGAAIVATTKRTLIEVMRTRDRNPLAVRDEIPTGHDLSISGVAVAGDTPHVATWSEDQTVRIIDTSSAEVVQVLRGHRAAVTACAFSSTRPWIAAGAADGTVIVWNFVDGKVISRLEGHLRAVRTIVFDNETVFTAGDDRTVKVWNAKNGREKEDYALPDRRVSACFALDPGFVQANDYGVQLRDLSSETAVSEIEVNHPILAASASGEHVAVCSAEARLVWVTSGRSFESETFPLSNVEDFSACAIDDDRTPAIGTVRGDVLVRSSRHHVHDARVSALAFAPGTPLLASAAWDGTLAVIDYRSPDVHHRIDAHDSRILALAVSPGIAVTGSAAGTLRVWDLHSGRAIATHRAHAAEVLGCWTDGDVILSWSRDGTLALRGEDFTARLEHREPITGVAVDRGRGIAYSCSEDRTIRAWSIHTGESMGVVYGNAPFRCITVRDAIVRAGDDLGNVWTLSAPVDVSSRPAASSPPYVVDIATGTTFFLEEGEETTIGKADPVSGIFTDIDLTPVDPKRSVSRRHAKIIRSGREYYLLEEIGTVNGTFVNGQRIPTGQPVSVHDGDLLKIGLIELKAVFDGGLGTVATPGAWAEESDVPLGHHIVDVETGTRFRLSQGDETTIGKTDVVTGILPDIDLTPVDPKRSVSRRHAKIIRSGSLYVILEEVGTVNGTYVNDQRIPTGTPVGVHDGDLIKIGLVTLKVVLV